MSNNLKQEFNRLASNAKHVPAPSVAADVSVSEFAMPAPGAQIHQAAVEQVRPFDTKVSAAPKRIATPVAAPAPSVAIVHEQVASKGAGIASSLDLSSLMYIVIGVVVVGLIGYVLYKRYREKKAAAAAQVKSSSSVAAAAVSQQQQQATGSIGSVTNVQREPKMPNSGSQQQQRPEAGQYPPQSQQYPPNGQYYPYGQYPPYYPPPANGQYPPMYPPNGQYPPMYAPNGQYPPHHHYQQQPMGGEQMWQNHGQQYESEDQQQQPMDEEQQQQYMDQKQGGGYDIQEPVGDNQTFEPVQAEPEEQFIQPPQGQVIKQ